jgi:hypothetical protein
VDTEDTESYWHADIADAPIEQQGGQVRGSLPWCSAGAGSHTRGNPLVWLYIIPAVESLRSHQLLQEGSGHKQGQHKGEISLAGRWLALIGCFITPSVEGH